MYLLDTHIVIWPASNPDKLDERLKNLLLQKCNKVYFSVVNLWEIIIKQALGKSDFNVDAKLLYEHLLDNNYFELPMLSKHCLTIKKLPMHHKDPFDRLLIAQAMSENFTLITKDVMISQYPHVKTFK